MPLQCDVIIDAGVAFDQPGQLADLLQHAAESEPSLIASAWQMTLRLTGDDPITELHERFFADPSPTDVITFPWGELPAVDGAHLGDVVVSVDAAAEQACEAGHSSAREVAFLALHGLLHLCGYDDATTQARDAMHQRQLLLLETWERCHGRPW